MRASSENVKSIIYFESDPITVGRSTVNQIAFPADLLVSREHAVIECTGDSWRIRDLESKNGTFLNGELVSSPAAIKDGDFVRVGSSGFLIRDDEFDLDRLDTQTVSKSSQVIMTLSKRECEVLRLLALGYKDSEIAEELDLSVKTVHSHLSRIRTKIHARRRADLTRFAVRSGLLDY